MRSEEHTESFLIITQILNLIVVVVEQPAQMQFVVVFGLELDGVALLRPLLAEHHLILVGVVVHCDSVSHVVAEGIHGIVFGGVDR